MNYLFISILVVSAIVALSGAEHADVAIQMTSQTRAQQLEALINTLDGGRRELRYAGIEEITQNNGNPPVTLEINQTENSFKLRALRRFKDKLAIGTMTQPFEELDTFLVARAYYQSSYRNARLCQNSIGFHPETSSSYDKLYAVSQIFTSILFPTIANLNQIHTSENA